MELLVRSRLDHVTASHVTLQWRVTLDGVPLSHPARINSGSGGPAEPVRAAAPSADGSAGPLFEGGW
jgi:hypothetical protein